MTTYLKPFYSGRQLCIETVLDHLPQNYTQEMYDEKCEEVYQHVYESYYGEGQGVYSFG